MIVAPSAVGSDLLERAYRDLDLDQGRLLQSSPQPANDDANWDSVGEWLMLAHRMEAERVFFVGDDPVILFARMLPSAGKAEILTAYRRAWSLSRPQCLFLATQDQLQVYALTAPPERSVDETIELKPVDVVSNAANVSEVLAGYHRDRIESGTLFDRRPYASREGRADAQLLHDVRMANRALVEDGLPAAVAHALIERVILIRYLEDRSIVTSEYFAEAASIEASWLGMLEEASEFPQLGARSTFVSCLKNREFTYDVFQRLEADFNGDLFQVEDEELYLVQQRHLDLVHNLLTGSDMGPQQALFLWAYDFNVVPTSLISSMYEQFYRAESEESAGTHYTPPELVEFVLSRVLNDDVLKKNPTICDPACGSGIFLVEAFRRLVRYTASVNNRPLKPIELKELLLSRIVGVDLNPAAIRLAAFSLYLAYLNYLEPRDIVRAGPLPRLIDGPDNTASEGVLVIADAFASMSHEERSNGDVNPPWRGRFFDVIVGNPPWSVPKKGEARRGDKWAHDLGFAVGDRSPSQEFLWLSLMLLRPRGVAAMLVNATAFHNWRETSRQFRSEWLRSVELCEFIDFTSSRDLFFEDGIAPFVLVVFRPRHSFDDASATEMFAYSSVRPSTSLQATRALAHGHLERRWVNQEALASRDYLWKTYAWGNHHDDSLMARLDIEAKLKDYVPGDPDPGFGYQFGTRPPKQRLSELRSLKRFNIWGALSASIFEDSPKLVKTEPDERRYTGQRIVVARGVRSGFGPSARLEYTDFSFRHTIYCIPLHSVPIWQAKTILGTMLSALGRYRLFMASGKWGLWHDEFGADDFLQLPIRMAGTQASVTRRISRVVDGLVDIEDVGELGSFLKLGNKSAEPTLSEMLFDLDEAVFDLFEATPPERDLVRDFIEYTLPLVGRRKRWLRQEAVEIGELRQGTTRDLASASNASQFKRYLSVFLHRWNRELAPQGEFSWFTATSPRTRMIAVVFETQEVGGRIADLGGDDNARWETALERLGQALEIPLTTSIRTAGTLRSVSDHHIVIAKRNEARLWTASAAREDAEATILQAINLQSAS